MRAFIAIPIGGDAIEAVEPLQNDLACGRLVSEENLHITLAFLDDQPEAALQDLHEALVGIKAPQFEWQFAGVDAKGKRKPSLVWASVEQSEKLLILQKRVLSAAHSAGMTLPRKRFRPHVTLARFNASTPFSEQKLGHWLTQYGAFHAGPFNARQFGLFRSTLTPDGPIYDVLSEFELN